MPEDSLKALSFKSIFELRLSVIVTRIFVSYSKSGTVLTSSTYVNAQGPDFFTYEATYL